MSHYGPVIAEFPILYPQHKVSLSPSEDDWHIQPGLFHRSLVPRPHVLCLVCPASLEQSAPFRQVHGGHLVMHCQLCCSLPVRCVRGMTHTHTLTHSTNLIQAWHAWNRHTHTLSRTKSHVRADRRGGMSGRPMQSGRLDMIVLFLRIAHYQGSRVSNETEDCYEGKCRQRATLSRAGELKCREFRVVQCSVKCTASILGDIVFVLVHICIY